jgi:hypothetical protein
MKFKKIAILLASLSMLAIGAQNAFAAEFVENSADNTFYSTSKQALDYGDNMVGTLSSPTDTDWFSFKPPADKIWVGNPGSYADITLSSPTGYNYGLSVTTSKGLSVSKTWLIQDTGLEVLRIYTEADTTYFIGVSNSGSNPVSTSQYQLTIR